MNGKKSRFKSNKSKSENKIRLIKQREMLSFRK